MSAYTVVFTKTAQKDLAQLPKAAQARITEAAYKLEDAPFPPGVKKLKGRAAQFRIRVGDYRIIYNVDGDQLIILILKIAHRQEAYE
jgi:mRNA interferase RelE/StbE